MTNLEKLYREVAPKVGLTVEEVERICRFQFLVVAEQMGTGEYKMVRLPLLGAFSPILARVENKHIKDIKKNFQAFGYHCY